MSNNHWKILGLPANRTTTANAVKRRVKNLSLKGNYRHPNKGGTVAGFQKLQKAQNQALHNIANGVFRAPHAYLNKNMYKKFANNKNYVSWLLVKKKLGRPLRNNNINPNNNTEQKLRNIIGFYTALNNKKSNAALNYLYSLAFNETRRRPNGSIRYEHHHGINQYARNKYKL